MDLYSLFKFLHISSAVIWVGGGFVLVLLGMVADRRADKPEFAHVVQNVIFLSTRFFIPVSLAAFVFGLIAAWLGWGFSQLWVWIGIAGFAATFCTGLFVLKPRADKIGVIVAKEGVSESALAVGRELLQASKFDYVMLFVVIADMVFKPAPSDWLLLVIMALAILAGGVAFLVPLARQARPAVA